MLSPLPHLLEATPQGHALGHEVGGLHDGLYRRVIQLLRILIKEVFQQILPPTSMTCGLITSDALIMSTCHIKASRWATLLPPYSVDHMGRTHLGHGHSDDLVDLSVKDGDTRVLGLLEDVLQLGEGAGLIQGRHIHTGTHGLLHL